ncbi:MAG TPA: DUF262 domain-containing protein [Bryobacteraceae bacterium]
MPMSYPLQNGLQFDDESDEQDVAERITSGTVAAVVSGTDWTTETIVSQLKRKNIQLRPRFQRRDAWKRDRKSRFIESLIVGLPIPQIVLAESKQDRGKFMVLDGKQRLLAILQYWGMAEGENNAYALSGVTLRDDLKGISFKKLSSDPSYESDFNALCNQPIRTVVIRNWKDTNFLHTVFLRLNTGSVSLSPQELRQALLPGPFSDYVDDATGNDDVLQRLLGLNGPDPRMRDIEIFARFIAFRFFVRGYPGRMKQFLDNTFEHMNLHWNEEQTSVTAAKNEFDLGIEQLLQIFGPEIARKPGSPQFNRAIFDALIFYHSQPEIRNALTGKRKDVNKAYSALFVPGSEFSRSIESDTAGTPNTQARLKIWGETLSAIAERPITIPTITHLQASEKPQRSRKPKRQ